MSAAATPERPSARIADEILSWEGITTKPGRFGSTEYYYGTREVGQDGGEAVDTGHAHVLVDSHACSEQFGADPRLVQVVEMRYFAGMTEQEIAVVLGVTDRTVRRDCEKARMLLAHALKD